MGDEVGALRTLTARLDELAAEAEGLRRERAAAIQRLRAKGWSLQRIADAVGRTKQTIDQWRRY